jgi:hypothetical protein
MKISPRLFDTDRNDPSVQPAVAPGSFAAKDSKRP